MRLVDNWRAVLRRAWSVRLILLAGLLSGLEIALPLIPADLVPIPAGLFAGLSFAATTGAFVARLLAQNTIGEKK